MKEKRKIFIKKLVYKSMYTGSRETDLILSRFAKEKIKLLNNNELFSYENLLNMGDGKIWQWVSGAQKTPKFKDKNITKIINIMKNMFV